jgi:uncharacterized protein YqgC (DUF456 family)
VAFLVALLLATALFLGLGIFLAGLLSIILSITDLSRWRHRMLWTVPVIGGTQVLAAVGVYVVGLRSTEWVLLPFLAAPILFSGLLLFLSPLYESEERGGSRRARWAAVLWIVLGLFLALPGILGIGAVIKMAITGEQVTFGHLFVTGGCLALTSPGGIICIVHGLRSLKRSA